MLLCYKGPSSQGYGFSSSHVWMWELDHKESWAPKSWCFWTVVLKTLESPLDCKEIQPVHPKGNQSWIFLGMTDAQAETPVLWPPNVKNWLIGKNPDAGKDWWQEEKGTTGWDGWMASPTRGTWVWVNLRVGDGQGSLACCSPWGHHKLDVTERLNWTEGSKEPTLECKLTISLSSVWIHWHFFHGKTFSLKEACCFLTCIQISQERGQMVWYS